MKINYVKKLVAILSLLVICFFAVPTTAQVRYPAPTTPCLQPNPTDPYTTPGTPANPNGPPPLRNPANSPTCYTCSSPSTSSCWWDQPAPANPTPVPGAPTKTRPAGVSCVICQITVTIPTGMQTHAACTGLANPQNFVHRSCDTSTPPAVPKTYDQLADQAKRRAQAICSNSTLPNDWCPVPVAPGGPGQPAAPGGPAAKPPVSTFATNCVSSDSQGTGLCRSCSVKAVASYSEQVANVSTMSASAEVCNVNLTVRIKDQQATSAAIQKLEARK